MKWLIVVIISLLLIVVSIAAYLGPDDLRSCGEAPSDKTGCQPADAIVAVSGGDTSARTSEAIKLYQRGWAKQLIFSGAAFDADSPSNAEVMRDQALQAGVSPDAILIDPSSNTTLENAANVSGIFADNDISSIILVTSAYHQRRTSLEFGKFDNITVRNHPVAYDNQWSGLWWLTPGGWWLAGSELVKITVFYGGSTR